MKSILAGAAMFAIAASANAETVQASATLVAPITVGSITDMSFGSVVPSASAGTVTLSTAGVRTVTGGVTLGNAGSTAVASVPLSGVNSGTFSVTLSSSVILAKSDSSTTVVTVDNFGLKVGSGTEAVYAGAVTGALSGAGTTTLLIGGRLNIPASAPVGDYNTNHSGGTPLTVTVNYN